MYLGQVESSFGNPAKNFLLKVQKLYKVIDMSKNVPLDTQNEVLSTLPNIFCTKSQKSRFICIFSEQFSPSVEMSFENNDFCQKLYLPC